MNPIQHMMVKAELFEATKTAIGMALDGKQQIAVSAMLAEDQAAFIKWLGTDAGRKAARVMAEDFTYKAPEPAKPEPPTQATTPKHV